MKKTQIRATYTDVCNAQDKLRKMIDVFIQEKRAIQNINERERFIFFLREATRGLGTQHKILFKGEKQTYDFGHAEHFAYILAYETEQQVTIQQTGEKIPIEKLWITLRDALFHIFPYAVTMSTQISHEQIKLGVSKAAEV